MQTETRIYNGPFPEVEIPLAERLEDGTRAIIARKGDLTELPAALAAALDEQGEDWLHPDGESKDTKEAVPRLRAQAKQLGIKVPQGAVKADIDLLIAEHEQSGGEASEPPEPTPLADLKRDELNAIAAEQGIESPDKLPNKEAVIEAVEAALQQKDDGDTHGVTAAAQNQPGDPSEPTADGGKE